MIEPADGNQRVFIDQFRPHGFVEGFAFHDAGGEAFGLVRAAVVEQDDPGLRGEVSDFEVLADFGFHHPGQEIDVVGFVVERGNVARAVEPAFALGVEFGEGIVNLFDGDAAGEDGIHHEEGINQQLGEAFRFNLGEDLLWEIGGAEVKGFEDFDAIAPGLFQFALNARPLVFKNMVMGRDKLAMLMAPFVEVEDG